MDSHEITVDEQQLSAVGEVGVDQLDDRTAAVGELEQQRLLDLVELTGRDPCLLGLRIFLGHEQLLRFQLQVSV